MTQTAEPAPSLAQAVLVELHVEIARQQLSLADLARRAGMTSTALGRRLRGEVPLTLADVDALAAALHVQPVYLLTPWTPAPRPRRRHLSVVTS